MKKEDVDKMTLQEACDYAVQKIVEQGGRCGDLKHDEFGFKCFYGKDEKHCAVGWLLDEHDAALMSYRGGISSMVLELRDRLPKLLLKNVGAFERLQEFHDEPSVLDRNISLKALKNYIDTSAPQYQQWIEMGE